MTPSTNATGRLPVSKGLLRPEEFARLVRFGEVPATGPAAQWVERVWSTSWELPDGVVHTTSLIPNPAVEVTVERGEFARPGRDGDGVWITGVGTSRFDVRLHGRGGAVGIKFRPGGFTAWSGVGSDLLTDRVRPAAVHLDGTDALRDLPLDAGESAPALLAFVERNAGDAAPIPELVQRATSLAVTPAVTRVDDLAARCGCSVRTLQRTLRRYVGVSPKWLIRRQRMHDAVAAMDAGSTESLADLASRLGWYDQNQFARDFSRLVGVPPSAYRTRSAPHRGIAAPSETDDR
ncbi:MAG: helix-turn-helix domain-containing protein [Micropruina sp.]|uniref:helix-turn-helix domain-containing protein n=1 Tax=Micropruina sp. TaxID=2737536 RepID=UPI0039E5BCF0